MNEIDQKPTKLVRTTYLTFSMIIFMWIIAWIVKVRLDGGVDWFSTGIGGFTYWTSAKLLIWIFPALWLVRISGRRLKQVFNLSNYRQWLFWGGVLGFLIALTGLIPSYMKGSPILPKQVDFAVVNVLVISPIFEEFLMRAAVLGNLQQFHSFWVANIITSFLFVGLHLPGWYFMGDLVENVTRLSGGALSIFLISLVFGYAVKRSNSVMGGILAHFLNNLA
jgi:membrane protease YdiL (CAAX protease family)